jgi:hypothetical protein
MQVVANPGMRKLVAVKVGQAGGTVCDSIVRAQSSRSLYRSALRADATRRQPPKGTRECRHDPERRPADISIPDYNGKRSSVPRLNHSTAAKSRFAKWTGDRRIVGKHAKA